MVKYLRHGGTIGGSFAYICININHLYHLIVMLKLLKWIKMGHLLQGICLGGYKCAPNHIGAKAASVAMAHLHLVEGDLSNLRMVSRPSGTTNHYIFLRVKTLHFSISCRGKRSEGRRHLLFPG